MCVCVCVNMEFQSRKREIEEIEEEVKKDGFFIYLFQLNG